MLILTRKVDQGIVISGNIHIRVLGVQRDRVKIGISAPREITVLRDELVDRDEKDDIAADAQKRSTNSHDEQILEINIGETEKDGSEREVRQPSED
ncbi:MAG: carbon storage regulator [Chloroflexi bacterium]|nr:carbon storage regulator [Chloroflexota bacterium]